MTDTPIISPTPNLIDVSPVTVTLTPGPMGADTMHYRTDGAAPTESDTTYTAPFAIAGVGDVVVSAIARQDAVNSAAVYATYTLDQIKYTTDGSDPTSGTVYSAPITLTSTVTLRAVAALAAGGYSDEKSAVYTVTAAGPVVPPPSVFFGVKI